MSHLETQDENVLREIFEVENRLMLVNIFCPVVKLEVSRLNPTPGGIGGWGVHLRLKYLISLD